MPSTTPSISNSRWLRRTTISSLALTGTLLFGFAGASSAQVAPTTEDARVDAAADAAAVDFVGLSVSVDGDTMIVGAPGDDDADPNAGAAYVFTQSGTAWNLQAKLTPTGPTLGEDLFGTSVGIDGETVTIGAPIANGGEPRSGATYVFVRSGTTWTQQARLVASDVTPRINLGAAVAIDGDTIVAGAPTQTDDSGPGSAYVFTRTGDTWTQQDKLTATDGAVNDQFGASVSIDGTTVVAGAPLADDTGTNEGAAYVFTQSGTTWSQQDKLVASDAQDDDHFGQSVAVDGTVIVAGAPEADSTTIFAEPGTTDDPGFDSGVAYVFASDGTDWTEQEILVASDEAGTDNFGSAVAVEANTIVVGSSGDSVGFGSSEGSAFVFVNSGTDWVEEEKLIASDGLGSDRLGTSVSLSGGTVVAGAPNVDIDVANQDSGAAYAFTINAPEFVGEEVEFFADDDDDGFGDPNDVQVALTTEENGQVVQPPAPAGYVANRTDCNDADDTVFPGATEVPDDGIDQDCDGEDAVTPPPAPEGPLCNGLTVTVNLANGDVPTDGDDVILGTDDDDVIDAGDGKDVICSGDGDDTITGGKGSDWIDAGAGRDIVNGNKGHDTLIGGSGQDTLRGGKGDDTINGGKGADALRGGKGEDTINGGNGNDDIRGGIKADVLNGDDGNDSIRGGKGVDVLDGGAGTDEYNGGGGTEDTCVVDANGVTEIAIRCEN